MLEVCDNIFKCHGGIELKLRDGEHSVWQGKPVVENGFTTDDILFFPVCVFWALFSFSWLFLSIAVAIFTFVEGGPPIVPILSAMIGLPFAAVGLYLVYGRFLYKKHMKMNTVYIITNYRIFIVCSLFKKRVISQDISSVESFYTSSCREGMGSISFGRMSFIERFGARTGVDILTAYFKGMPPIFHDIDNVEEVYLKLQELRASESQLDLDGQES